MNTLVQELTIGQVKTYDICSIIGHPIDMCPTLQEKHANAIGGFSRQRPKYDPYTNTYNPK